MNADDGPKATMKRLGTFVRSNYVEIVLALVILLALAGTGMRLYQQTIDAVFLGLLVVAIGGAVVARYLPDLMRRITKIGPGGVELSTLTSPDPPVLLSALPEDDIGPQVARLTDRCISEFPG